MDTLVEKRSNDGVLSHVRIEMPQQGCDSLLLSDALIKAGFRRDLWQRTKPSNRLFHCNRIRLLAGVANPTIPLLTYFTPLSI